MAAIDTNVLVRYLTADDAAQYKASVRLFAKSAVFIPDSVVLEAAWVLRAAYGLRPAEICDALRQVFGLENVTLANARQVSQALAWHEGGLDFADAFHLAQSQQHDELKTFDAAFIKQAKGMGRCRVEKV